MEHVFINMNDGHNREKCTFTAALHSSAQSQRTRLFYGFAGALQHSHTTQQALIFVYNFGYSWKQKNKHFLNN